MVTKQRQVNAKIVIDGNVVRKTLPSEIDLALVLRKHRLFYEMSLSHGFITAEPIESQSYGSTLVLEYLDLGTPATEVIGGCIRKGCQVDDCERLMSDVGIALGRIHTHLMLEPVMYSTSAPRSPLNQLRGENDSVENAVFLHGDFTLNNIFFSKSGLTLIDPLPNNHSTFFVNEKGSAYLELAVFCNSVIRQIGYRDLTQRQWKKTQSLISAVLQGYCDTTGVCRIDLPKLAKHVIAVDVAIRKAHPIGFSVRMLRPFLSRFLTRQCIRETSK